MAPLLSFTEGRRKPAFFFQGARHDDMNLAEAIQQSVALMKAGRQAESTALCHKVLDRRGDKLHL